MGVLKMERRMDREATPFLDHNKNKVHLKGTEYDMTECIQVGHMVKASLSGVTVTGKVENLMEWS